MNVMDDMNCMDHGRLSHSIIPDRISLRIRQTPFAASFRGMTRAHQQTDAHDNITLVIARSAAMWQSMQPSGLPRAFGPRNDGVNT
jgi:hypothetical protein